MITTIINGIIIDAESIAEVHYVERRYHRYESEKRQEYPCTPRPDSEQSDEDTITQIVREIMSSIKRGQ